MRAGTRRRGHTDIRGLDTAGRAVRQERFCWSKNRAWRRGVNPVAAHSSHANHSGRGRLLVFLVRLLWGVDRRDRCGPLGPPKKRLFLGPDDSCACVAGVNMEQAQPSEHERR